MLKKLLPALLVFISVGFISTSLAQTTVYWDRNGSTAGAGGASPSGTWVNNNGAPNRNWSTSSAGTVNTARWNDGSYAVFSAGTDATGSYTVTVSGTVSVDGITIEEGTPTFSGGTINFGDSTPDFIVNTGSTAIVDSRITGSDGLTKGGAGTLILNSTANSWTGPLTINAGLVQLNTSNVIPDASAVTIASGATLRLNAGVSETIGVFSGAGTFEKLGAGTFTLGSDSTFGGTFLLGGGTLNLGGNNLIVDTLRITGNSVIDFGSAVASTLSVVNFIIDAGVNLTITNWTDTMDYFFTQYWAGAVFNTTGAAPMNQITFTGFAGNDTRWQDFDSQITPVPEPATYGAMLVGAMGVFFAWRRWRQTKSAA